MRRAEGLLIATAFTLLLAAGYANGNMARVFSPATPEARRQAEQRSLGHLGGSETDFDAAADNVTKTAHGARDSVTWKKTIRRQSTGKRDAADC